MPFGILSAIYISEIAPARIKEILKSVIELLAGLPSVVLGFFGMVILAPWMQETFDLPTGLNIVNASLMLAVMAIPTISSISEDALYAVPREFKEASYALGATKYETIVKVAIPAALSGISTAVILGMARAIGETMVVLMVAGGAAAIPAGHLRFGPAHAGEHRRGDGRGALSERPLPCPLRHGDRPFLHHAGLQSDRRSHLQQIQGRGVGNAVNTETQASFMKWRYFRQSLFFGVVRLSALIITLALLGIIAFLLVNGIRAITWDFLTLPPTDSMTKGGIMPAIVGTFYLTVGAIVVALPLGVVSAIYLTEYAKQGLFIRIIRIGVNCLAGVPSVVFGLFGLGFFVVFLKFGSSILAGSLTLGILILPTIIGAAEEALKAVPQTFREASLALGVSKWRTISRIVLPSALPGILTGAILGVGRAAGETAPIMFTAAAFFTAALPKSIFDEVMALPYHIYVLATAGTHIEQTRPLQYGTALVLIALVLGIDLIAIVLRSMVRRKKRW